jgi:hypothetical protein
LALLDCHESNDLATLPVVRHAAGSAGQFRFMDRHSLAGAPAELGLATDDLLNDPLVGPFFYKNAEPLSGPALGVSALRFSFRHLTHQPTSFHYANPSMN